MLAPADSGNQQSTAEKKSYNYPNPFRPGEQQTVLRYELETAQRVSIGVYDMSNRLVRTILDDQTMAAGVHNSETWDGTNESGREVANGVYFARIKTIESIQFIRIVVMH